MNNLCQQLIYLMSCAVNNIPTQKEYLQDVDIQGLYHISASHQLEALVGRTLQKAGISLSKEWNEAVSKAIRKTILFDSERAKLLNFMENKGIWYLPLKGIVIKDYYPALGMRQMSDNDILYDESFCEDVQKYMESQGYTGSYVGRGHHDVYKKEPIFNFELHRSLYWKDHQEGWMEYYQHVKEKLVLNSGSLYGYHFRDEDFYIYMVSHAYKHYTGSGTGLRTLLDFYVYLKVKEKGMDFKYIEKECKILEIAEFERLNRVLCRKVFGEKEQDGSIQQFLNKEEAELLKFYTSSGVYGTVERAMESRIRKYQKKTGSRSKIRYMMSRVFSASSIYWDFPFAARHKWLLPFACIGRVFKILFSKKRRKRIRQEFEAAGKVEYEIQK